jgi:putative hydrolase of the HAD superfamily
MVDVYRRHRPVLELLPDARVALEWSKRVGVKSALITDGYAAVQRNKLAALGLHDQIDCCVVSDEIGGTQFWKPHVAPFLKVMDELKAAPDGFAYVADNPRKDFLAPRKLRWRTVRIRRPGAEHSHYEPRLEESAEREITSLELLPTIFLGPAERA